MYGILRFGMIFKSHGLFSQNYRVILLKQFLKDSRSKYSKMYSDYGSMDISSFFFCILKKFQ